MGSWSGHIGRTWSDIGGKEFANRVESEGGRVTGVKRKQYHSHGPMYNYVSYDVFERLKYNPFYLPFWVRGFRIIMAFIGFLILTYDFSITKLMGFILICLIFPYCLQYLVDYLTYKKHKDSDYITYR